MINKSSKKNKFLFAACLIAALSLCLGGFFIFQSVSKPSESVNTQGTCEGRKTYFISNGIAFESAEITLSAHSAIMIEADSGEVIFSKNPDQKMPMASTTKIMTALVALENCDTSKKVTVSPDATNIEGSSIYLYPGEEMTLLDLLYGMMLESANDAAAAIAIEVGGDIESFASMMNKKAEALGLENTHFENPHGLDSEEHYTTARELAIIAREAYSNPIFKEIVATHKKTIPLGGDEGARLLINHNKLLKRYEGATGIKTGFTKKSGRCLVASAERDGLEFITVTLNSPDDWNDHKKMLDLGFSSYETKVLCEIGKPIYTLASVGATEDHAILTASEELRVIVPRNAGEIECVIELPRFVFAPLAKGEAAGMMVFYLDGKVIAQTELLNATELHKRKEKGIFERIFGDSTP